MYTVQPKKMLIMNILDILRKYTDADHRLSQKDIVDILKNEYNMTANRKSIRRNILELIAFGYEIEYNEVIRMTPVMEKVGKSYRKVIDEATGQPLLEESSICSDFYLVRDLSDGELRLLIDSLLFSKHLPYAKCRELVEKLESLSNVYFRSRIKYISTMPDNEEQDEGLFTVIGKLDDAISRSRQVSFTYNGYGLDKQLHPVLDKAGKKRVYIVNPYQMAATNGRYYLIGNYDKYDDVANFRIDRISDIKVLDSPAKPARKVKGLENGVDLPRHMAEHVYMFSGESGTVRFRAKKRILNDVIDWFGKDIRFSEETADAVTVTVRVNLQAMRRWALQYSLHTRILSPQSLADEVKADIRGAMENYDTEI